MATTVTLVRATPMSLLYLVSDSVGGGTKEFGTFFADVIPGSPLANALASVRTDTDANVINDLFEGPPIGAVNVGGGTPGTGVALPTGSEIRTTIKARASVNNPSVPIPVPWAVTGIADAGFAALVMKNAGIAACDAYLEIRLFHSKAA